MVEDALGERPRVRHDPAGPDRAAPAPTGPGLYRVGCLGRITSFSETDDGRYLITLTGADPLRRRRSSSRCAAATAGSAPISPASRPISSRPPQPTASSARRCCARCAPISPHRGFDANWDAIDEMPDDDAGRHPGHGLPVRAAGEAGAAGGAAPRRSGRQPCSPCCRWARTRRARPSGASASWRPGRSRS